MARQLSMGHDISYTQFLPKMRQLYSLLLILFPLNILAQEISLNGQIAIHNSLYNTGAIEYVSNAYVSAPFTNPDATDGEGMFSLKFVGLDGGTQVDLSVEKAGLEVVNSYDLQRVIIGRKLPLRVYLAKKGELAIAQTELYEISKEALFASRDSIIARLESDAEIVIADLEKQLGQEIATIYKAKELINKTIKSLEKRLPETTQRLATINLDFASELYRKAYEHFKKGEIEEAIKVLDEAHLDESVENALSQIAEADMLKDVAKELQEKGQLQIEQDLDSYRLKVESHILLFQYRDAVRIQGKVIQLLLDAREIEDGEIAGEYNNLSLIYLELGLYKQALEAQQNTVKIWQEELEPNNPDLAISYNNLSLIYFELGLYKQALEAQQKALEIRDEVLEPTHPYLALSYSNLAVIYQSIELYDQALEAQQKALSIRETILEPLHPDLAVSYNNLSGIYLYQGKFDLARESQKKAFSIQEEVLPHSHPDFAQSYITFSAIYLVEGIYDQALEAQQKALAIQEETLGNKHPKFAQSLKNVAIIYSHLEDYQKAESYLIHAVTLFENALGPDDPRTIDTRKLLEALRGLMKD